LTYESLNLVVIHSAWFLAARGIWQIRRQNSTRDPMHQRVIECRVFSERDVVRPSVYLPVCSVHAPYSGD